MRTHFSEALGHAKSLIEVGCDSEEAIADAQRTFELDELTADVLGQCVEVWIATEYAHG
jgi:hypothetical protein